MLPLSTGMEASAGVRAPLYQRHRPERIFLYQLVREYYPALKADLEAQGRALPGYVNQEFEDYLKCGYLKGKNGSGQLFHVLINRKGHPTIVSNRWLSF